MLLFLDPESSNVVDIDVDISLKDSNLICITEDGGYFLKRHAFRVREGEPHEKPANGARNDESEVEFPSDGSVSRVSRVPLTQWNLLVLTQTQSAQTAAI